MGTRKESRWPAVLAQPLLVFVSGSIGIYVNPPSVLAAGFAITAQGAAGMSRSSAFTAQADDPSAVYYNPAGLSQLSWPTVLLGTSILRPHTGYEPASTGLPAEERERYYVLPHFYVTSPLGDRVTAGLGLFAPFGLSTKWPADWDGRFQVIDATIRTATVNPVLAWRPTEWLTIAGGVHYSEVKLSQRRAVNLPGASDGMVSLEGDTTAVGYNGALLVTPSHRWQFGASYRSRTNAEIGEGHADFTVPALFAGAFTDGPIRTEVTLPPSLRTGLLFRVSQDWNVEVDATWTGWSTIDQFEVQFANGLDSEVTTFGWHDAMTYSVGIEHQWSPGVHLRGGYLYDFTPIPDDKANPLIPDADRQGVSVGVGLGGTRWVLDMGYQYVFFNRDKENDFGARYSSVLPPVDARANGTYRSNAHVFGVSLGYNL